MKLNIQQKLFYKVSIGGVLAIAIISISLITISSCSHDGDISQIEPISYSASIAPIISTNCSMPGCHDGGKEFSLNSYSQVMNSITAGDSKTSKIYQVVTSSYDFIRMPPQPAAPLTKQQRTLIDVWILQGAKNN